MAATQSGAKSRPVSVEGMARVRVYTRTGSGKRIAMVGLIPRESLDEIRRRWTEASRGGAAHCKLAARVKRLEVVQVSVNGGEETVTGRRVLLGVTVRRETPTPAARSPKPVSRSRVLQRELEELALLAERIQDGAAVAR